MGVFEFEVGQFLEEKGVLMGELDDEVGDWVGGAVLIMERKVKMPRNIFLKSKFFTLLNTSFRAFTYFLIGNSYLPSHTLTPLQGQSRSRSSRYYSLQKTITFKPKHTSPYPHRCLSLLPKFAYPAPALAIASPKEAWPLPLFLQRQYMMIQGRSFRMRPPAKRRTLAVFLFSSEFWSRSIICWVSLKCS